MLPESMILVTLLQSAVDPSTCSHAKRWYERDQQDGYATHCHFCQRRVVFLRRCAHFMIAGRLLITFARKGRWEGDAGMKQLLAEAMPALE